MNKRIKSGLGIGAIASLVIGLLTVTGSASAFADTGVSLASASKNDQGQCLITPAKTSDKEHDAVYEDVTETTPGEDAVTRRMLGTSRTFLPFPSKLMRKRSTPS